MAAATRTKTVQHGRRKGLSRDENIGNLPAIVGNNAMNAPTIDDLRKVTILSQADMDRIHFQLNKREIEKEHLRMQKEEEDRLKNLSKEQISKWTNTIQGQRQKKLEARARREEEEEEARKIADLEEEKFQAEKRKEAIERAKTQQYYQTDRLKGFHGALMLTEVLKERDAQVELKALKEAALSSQDKDWLLKARKDYEVGILKDQAQVRKEAEKMKQTAEFQKLQVNDRVQVVNKEKQEDLAEGAELKRLAAQYEEERRRLDAIRRQEGTELMVDNRRQIEAVQQMRDVQREQEAEEDDECRIYAAAKHKMKQKRVEKEKQLHDNKQKRLEVIRDKLQKQQMQKLDDADSRIARASQEAEEKRLAEEQRKAEWNKLQHQQMIEHRTTQLAEQERVIKEAQLKEMEMLAVREEAEKKFQANEAKKASLRHEEKKSLQKAHIGQIDEHVKEKDEARELQLQQDMLNDQLMLREEKQFQEYADKVITHCSKAGRNVYPLRKAAQEGAGGGRGPVFQNKGGVRPSYMVADTTGVQMPNYQRGTTDEVKDLIYGNGNTDKRLGFVWS